MNFRDSDLCIWSKPTRSRKLDAAYQAKRDTVKSARSPDIHRCGLCASPNSHVVAMHQRCYVCVATSASLTCLAYYWQVHVHADCASMRSCHALALPSIMRAHISAQTVCHCCGRGACSRHEVLAKSQAAEEDKRLTALCQKDPDARTREEVAFIRSFTASLCPFFALWPEALQVCALKTYTVMVRGREDWSAGWERNLRCQCDALTGHGQSQLTRRRHLRRSQQH